MYHYLNNNDLNLQQLVFRVPEEQDIILGVISLRKFCTFWILFNTVFPFALCFFITVLALDILFISVFNQQPLRQSIAGSLIFFRPFWIFLCGITIAAVTNNKKINAKLLKIVLILFLFFIRNVILKNKKSNWLFIIINIYRLSCQKLF